MGWVDDWACLLGGSMTGPAGEALDRTWYQTVTLSVQNTLYVSRYVSSVKVCCVLLLLALACASPCHVPIPGELILLDYSTV